MTKTSSAAAGMSRANTDADNELRLDYLFENTTSTHNFSAMVRFVNWDNLYYIKVQPGLISIVKRVSGNYATIATANVSTDANEWYTLRVVTEGADMTVYRTTAGELEEEIVSASDANAPSTTTSRLFWAGGSVPVRLDNIRMLSDDLSTESAFAYDHAYELTTMTRDGATTAYGYDAWGRMTSRARGAFAASYAYGYGDKLYSVETDFPDEADVTYDYDGSGRRRARATASEYTWYNWDAGYNTVSEEAEGEDVGDGELVMTYAPFLAHVAGSDPSAGAYGYYALDNTNSARAVYGQIKAPQAAYAYVPYGEAFAAGGAGVTHRRSGYEWDAASGLHYAAFRYYMPEISRWTTRDPLGYVDGPRDTGNPRITGRQPAPIGRETGNYPLS